MPVSFISRAASTISAPRRRIFRVASPERAGTAVGQRVDNPDPPALRRTLVRSGRARHACTDDQQIERVTHRIPASTVLMASRICSVVGDPARPAGVKYTRHDRPGGASGAGNSGTPSARRVGDPRKSSFRFLLRLDELPAHRDVGSFRGDHREAIRGRLPVRAPIEVLQRDLHASTVNVAARYKVKW